MATVMRVLRRLRTCMAGRLAEAERGVCALPIIWGDSPLPAQRCDCECEAGHGEGWLRLVRLDHRDRAPGARSLAPQGCASLVWEAQVEIGVWRCAPTLDAAGNPPSDEEYEQATADAVADTIALQRTWECCEELNRVQMQLDTVVPSGPSGGCVGVVATGRIRLDGCTCPEAGR